MARKRKTAGERIAGQPAKFVSWCSSYSFSTLASMIDRAIRRAQAEARAEIKQLTHDRDAARAEVERLHATLHHIMLEGQNSLSRKAEMCSRIARAALESGR